MVVSSASDRHLGMDFGGGYLITKKIAQGGMGALYLATHPASGMKKAVKFILEEFASNPAIAERFDRECKAAVRLKGHRNIVAIDSYGTSVGEKYLVMEYLEGETLEQHLKRHAPISREHAFRLLAQIINALHALHTAGIVHRDLKPSNVFLVASDDEPYVVKVIDFGIIHDREARLGGALQTQQGSAIGTPGYMAVEQYGQANSVTASTDVFALAVMTWEMFNLGVRPWGEGLTDFDLWERQKYQPPTLLAGNHLPPEWEAVLRAALSPDPLARPVLHALLFALGRAIQPPPPAMNGAQMITRYAPKVLINTPVEVETVRAADAHQAAAALWAMQRATRAPEASHPQAWTNPADHIPLSAPGRESTPPGAPTVTARPAIPTPPAPKQTTLSASAGASIPSGTSEPTSRRRAARTIVAVAGAVAVGALVFGVVFSRSHAVRASHQTAAPNQEAETAPASVVVPAPAVAVPPAGEAPSPPVPPPGGEQAHGDATPNQPKPTSTRNELAASTKEDSVTRTSTRRTAKTSRASTKKPSASPAGPPVEAGSATSSTPSKRTFDPDAPAGARPNRAFNPDAPAGEE